MKNQLVVCLLGQAECRISSITSLKFNNCKKALAILVERYSSTRVLISAHIILWK